LSIVAAVAKLHGFRLTVEDNAPGAPSSGAAKACVRLDEAARDIGPPPEALKLPPRRVRHKVRRANCQRAAASSAARGAQQLSRTTPSAAQARAKAALRFAVVQYSPRTCRARRRARTS